MRESRTFRFWPCSLRVVEPQFSHFFIYTLGSIMAHQKIALSDSKNGLAAPTQKSSPDTGLSLRLVEAIGNVHGDTANDVSDMRRLGKKQEFRV